MYRPMTLMIAFLILFLPNQLHLPTQFGSPGLNAFNLFFLLAFAMLLAQRTGNRNTTPVPRPPLLTPLLVFYAALTVSLVIGLAGGSIEPMRDIAIFKTVITSSMLYFLAYYGVNDRRTVHFLIAVLVFVFAIAALEGIKEGIQYGFGNYNDEKRAAGPFGQGSGNSNYAGVFYGIFCSFCLALAVLGRHLKLWWRAALLGCYGLGCIAIFATFSRQSMLLVAVTTFLTALRRSPVLVIVPLLGMASYPFWAPEGVVERIQMTQEETTTGQVELENSAASRYELWNGAIEIIKENPLGVGFNQFQDEIEPHLPDWVAARDAQDQYLLIGAEAGIQGLAAFILLIIALFGIGRRLRRVPDLPDAHVLGSAMTITVVGVIMGNIYSSTFFSGELMSDFWILAGLLSRYRILAANEALDVTPATQSLTPLERARLVHARWQRSREESSEAGQ